MQAETQYFGYPVPAQPSPDAAKVEEIALACAEQMALRVPSYLRDKEIALLKPTFLAILRPYFPAE